MAESLFLQNNGPHRDKGFDLAFLAIRQHAEQKPYLIACQKVAESDLVIRAFRTQKDNQMVLQCLKDIFLVGIPIILIDNAIKYAPSRSEITVSMLQRRHEVVVQVKDQGPGISPKHHGKIFQRFYRINRNVPKKRGSTGLGLAIAKKAIEMQKGSIALESEVGKGACFSLVFHS